MSHPHATRVIGRALRRGTAAPALALVGLAAGALPAAAQNSPVESEYQGTWVPAKATCESAVRFIVGASRLTLVNGKDTEVFGDVHQAGPSYFGPDYSGILVVVIAEFNGDQPLSATFNFGEKKGVAQLDYAMPTPGPASNVMLTKLNTRYTKLALAKRFPMNKVTLKKCPGESGAGGARAAPQPQASGRPSGAAGPSVCTETPHCTEVKPFALTVTDFRNSTAGSTRMVTLNLRFQNRTDAPLTLGYVQGSGIVTDDRGNRYTVSGQGAVRGIGEISNNTFDPKFTLQPGEASDARIEFQWTPQRGQIFGTTYDVELAVREIESLPADQYQLGKEYALKLDGFTAGAAIAAAQPGMPTSGVVSTSTAASVPAPDDGSDACAGKERCYNAGPFAASVTQVTASKVTYYVIVKLNVKVRNVTAQPLLLGWKNGSGSAIDDVGNRYAAKTVKGIGLVSASTADPQFGLNPGQSRAFTVEYVFRANRSTVGTSWTAEFVLEQLEILPSRQVRSVRDYSVSYQDLTQGKSAGTTGPGSASANHAGDGDTATEGAGAAATGIDSSTANAVNATAGAVKAVGKLFKK